jgi:(p)ppGpp synthase/HD superfamily hydrolase
MSNLEKRARIFAIKWHGTQARKYTGEMYWKHPMAVAELVKSVPHTDEMIAAAWLHDVVEDTACTPEEIDLEFGNLVSSYVFWLTDVSRPEHGNRQARKTIDRAHTAAAPREAKTVKLADLIDNSKSIMQYDPDFAKIYLREKRLLLDEALKDGDASLWTMADEIVKNI